MTARLPHHFIPSNRKAPSDTDTNQIEVTRFQDYTASRLTLPLRPGTHGGADDTLMHNFIQALRANDPAAVLTTPAESLATHCIVFAAERSRREGRRVDLSEGL